MKINFGIDWDGTVDRAPAEFLAFAKSLMAAGHGVYIVTMRYPSESKEIEEWRQHVTDIIFTERMAKHKACLNKGVHITVWIEDTPKAVHMDGEEIWGFVTPEGYVHRNPVLESATIRSKVMVPVDKMVNFIASGVIEPSWIDVKLTEREQRADRISRKHVFADMNFNTGVIANFVHITGKAPMIPVIQKDGMIVTKEAKTIASIAIINDIELVVS